MRDKKKIYNYIKAQINPFGRPYKGNAYELGLKIMNYIENMDEAEESFLGNDVTGTNVGGKWIPCSERLPKNEDYILVSFENYTLPDIARYEEDEEGGTFYPGDDENPYTSYGIFVNAWMSLPEPYRGE